ncbi:MAG: LPS export ABC transporter periplasmic protein LptC [Candidatus Riflebacteria bacterium]|nr:LPS export ABC transporter periplasmic protein LptC [Candidatus Riflebacteria bacterium]
MRDFYTKGWFWFLVLMVFLIIILKDDDLEKDVQSKYQKARMKLTDVHFSELDQGFEHARMYADVVDMDDSQNNMNASRVRTLFFDKEVATRTGQLVASWAFKTPFEARFWGDVRMRSSDGQRMRSEELRYFFSRKELYTSMPVTIWKDDMIITGREFRYNTQDRTGSLERDVLIRIWPSASETAAASRSAAAPAAAAQDGMAGMGAADAPAEVTGPPGQDGHFLEIPANAPEDAGQPGATVSPATQPGTISDGSPAGTPPLATATGIPLPRRPGSDRPGTRKPPADVPTATDLPPVSPATTAPMATATGIPLPRRPAPNPRTPAATTPATATASRTPLPAAPTPRRPATTAGPATATGIPLPAPRATPVVPTAVGGTRGVASMPAGAPTGIPMPGRRP